VAAFALGGQANAQPITGSWEGELVQRKSWPIFVRLDVESGTGESTLSFLGQKIALGRAADDHLSATIGDAPDTQLLAARVENGELKGTLKGGGADLAFTLERIPEATHATDRVAGWNADLDALQDRVLRFDRSFSNAEKRQVRVRIAALRKAIPRSSDDAIRVQIAEFMAIAHNAHTRLYLLRNRTELSRLPIRIWWFGDDLRIIRSTPQFDHLLGCKVTSLNNVPTTTAYERVQGMYAGSATWKRYMSQYTLTSPGVLHGAGVGNSSSAVRLGVTDCGRAGSYRLGGLPFERSEKAVESWWDLAPQSPSALEGWRHVLRERPLPAYLKNARLAYWFETSASGRIFFLQLNRAGNSGSETVKDFAQRAAAEIREKNPRAIVVDLRFNTGGDSTITKVLVDELVGAAQRRPMYVIVGRSTFSAGIVAAAQFRQAAKVIVVGEPVGDGLEFWAEGGNIILPYSGLAAHFANGAHSLSPRPCPTRDYCDDLSVASLAPDIPVQFRWSDYRSGIDPSMHAIEADLARRRF
jgi:hypothetical protein